MCARGSAGGPPELRPFNPRTPFLRVETNGVRREMADGFLKPSKDLSGSLFLALRTAVEIEMLMMVGFVSTIFLFQ